MNAKARRKTQKSAFYGAPTKDADHRRRNGEGHPAVCLPKGIGSCRRLPRFRAYGKCLSLSYVYIISPALPRVRRGHLAVCPPKGVGSCRKLPRSRAYGKLRRVSFDPVESARSHAYGKRCYRLISPSHPKRPHAPARMGKGALRHRRRRRCSAQRASRSSSTARQ